LYTAGTGGEGDEQPDGLAFEFRRCGSLEVTMKFATPYRVAFYAVVIVALLATPLLLSSAEADDLIFKTETHKGVTIVDVYKGEISFKTRDGKLLNRSMDALKSAYLNSELEYNQAEIALSNGEYDKAIEILDALLDDVETNRAVWKKSLFEARKMDVQRIQAVKAGKISPLRPPRHDLKEPCPDCKGTGKISCPNCEHGWLTCPDCGGSWKRVCATCGGEGRVATGLVLRDKTTGKDVPSYRPCPDCAPAYLYKGKIYKGLSWTCKTCARNECPGKVPCKICGKTGLVLCPTCKGTGRLDTVSASPTPPPSQPLPGGSTVFSSPEVLTTALLARTPPMNPRALAKWNTLSLLEQDAAEERYLRDKKAHALKTVDCVGKEVTWPLQITRISKIANPDGYTIVCKTGGGHSVLAFCAPSFKNQLSPLGVETSAIATGTIRGWDYGAAGEDKRFTFHIDVDSLQIRVPEAPPPDEAPKVEPANREPLDDV
jgi:hypothetical protein